VLRYLKSIQNEDKSTFESSASVSQWDRMGLPIKALGNLALFLATAAGLLPASGADLLNGSELEIRLLHGVGTRISKVGDAVEATVIAPMSEHGVVVIPAGTTVFGVVAHKDSLGLGLRHTAARLDLRFQQLQLPDGSTNPINAQVVAVETARESVRAPGQVVGIHPTASVSTGVSFVFAVLFFGQPAIRIPVVTFRLLTAKLLAARSPDAEILFPAGTEMRLRLTQNAEVEQVKNGPVGNGAVPVLAAPEVAAVQKILTALPEQQAIRDAHPSDLVNIMVSGSREEVERAFQAAGWHAAEHHGVMALYHIYHCGVERMGNSQGPMTRLKLGGRGQDLSYQKSLDTFSKRHHIRLWQDPETGAWLGAATEDVGYRVEGVRLTHASDRRIDNERAKVVNDLAFTGCVARGALIPRASLKPAEERGHPIVSDGDIAVLKLNSCRNANGMPFDPPKPVHVRAVRIAEAMGEDLIRSNPVTIGYGMAKSMVENSKLQANAPMEASRTYIRPITVSTVANKPADSVLALR
jgi:LssY C-terminus